MKNAMLFLGYLFLGAILFCVGIAVFVTMFIIYFYTKNDFLFIFSALFILYESIFACIKLTKYLRNKPQKTLSKTQKTVRKIWLTVGIVSILIQPLFL